MGFLKQRNIGRWWGYTMQVIQQEAIVIQGSVLILQLITTASVLQIRGYEIPVWLLAVIVAGLLVLGAVVVFSVGVPSYFNAFNDQWWKHNNPMRKEIDAIKENQRLIMEKLGIKENADKTS